MRRLMIPILLLIAALPSYGQHPWELGESETLWRQRYGNCDYGMFVQLPDGVVGHGTLPPAPNHGITVRLPDVHSTAELRIEKENRYIWINAEYNASDDSSIKGTAEYYADVFVRDRHGKVTKHSTNLASLPATRLKVAYKSGNELVIEELVIAQRAGIVYEIGLRTNGQSYAEDCRRFEQLMSGFGLSELPKGECSNG